MQSCSLSWGTIRPLAPYVPVSNPSSSARNTISSVRAVSVVARANNSDRPGSSSNGGRSQDSRRSKPERKARKPGLFEVKVVTPPPRSLGVYALPPLTHNGEEIEIDGEGYVVTSLVLRYKLQKGKYVRDHSRLEVQPTGRYFLNMMLDNLIHATYMGPTGEQD